MPTVTPSFGGAVNNVDVTQANQREIWLKMFSGEVLHSYNVNQVTRDKHKVKSVTSGKSHQFPESWKATAYSHVPGQHLIPQKIASGERTITIDDLDVAPVFVADIDDAIGHIDNRAEWSFQLGQALANLNDKNVFRVMFQAARETAGSVTNALNQADKAGAILNNTTFGFATNNLTTDLRVNKDSLITALYRAAQTLDEKNVPEMNRNVFLAPAQYYLLVASGSDIMNRDFGGDGSVKEAEMRRIAAMNIVRSNNLRSIVGVDESAVTTINAKYRADHTNAVALVTTPESVGTIDLISMQTRAWEDMDRQGWMINARKANGHGVLRPEAALEIAAN